MLFGPEFWFGCEYPVCLFMCYEAWVQTKFKSVIITLNRHMIQWQSGKLCKGSSLIDLSVDVTEKRLKTKSTENIFLSYLWDIICHVAVPCKQTKCFGWECFAVSKSQPINNHVVPMVSYWLTLKGGRVGRPGQSPEDDVFIDLHQFSPATVSFIFSRMFTALKIAAKPWLL